MSILQMPPEPVFCGTQIFLVIVIPLLTMMKDPKEYSVEEVSIWLGVVGLGEFADNFRENSVNGGLLVTLEGNDLKELGLSGLQSKKLLRGLEQTKEMFEGGGGGADPAEIEALQKQVADLQRENAALNAELEKYKPKAAPAPAPAPAPASTHKTQHHDAPVLRGAAGGAARGVVLVSDDFLHGRWTPMYRHLFFVSLTHTHTSLRQLV